MITSPYEASPNPNSEKGWPLNLPTSCAAAYLLFHVVLVCGGHILLHWELVIQVTCCFQRSLQVVLETQGEKVLYKGKEKGVNIPSLYD